MPFIIETEPHYDHERTTPFGEWMTQRRLALGWKQMEVACRLGVNCGRVSEWEQGRKEPTEEQEAAIRAVLRVR